MLTKRTLSSGWNPRNSRGPTTLLEALRSLNLSVQWESRLKRIFLDGKPLERYQVFELQASLESNKGILVPRSMIMDALTSLAHKNPFTSVVVRATDHWETRLASIGGEETNMNTCLQVLGIPDERVNRSVEIRIGNIMAKLGWSRTRVMEQGTRRYVYRKST